jgi:hypothetical protein
MTRKQFKRNKKERLFQKTNPDETLEKPAEADPEETERSFQNWRSTFLSQFAWYRGKTAAVG